MDLDATILNVIYCKVALDQDFLWTVRLSQDF